MSNPFEEHVRALDPVTKEIIKDFGIIELKLRSVSHNERVRPELLKAYSALNSYFVPRTTNKGPLPLSPTLLVPDPPTE